MRRIYLKTGKLKKDSDLERLKDKVAQIIQEVKTRGDMALRELTSRFDHLERKTLVVTKEEKEKAWREVPKFVIQDLQFSAENIRKFAQMQRSMLEDKEIEILPGLFVGHHLIPVKSAGVYVPGGRYPLVSTALNGIIPAKVAGVERIIACSPPFQNTGINPFTLVAMEIAGVDEIYTIGGAQAIAAMAYGTESVSPVDLIVGPGNAYVTEAKKQVYGQVGVDTLAGPSDVLIIADEEANPELVAADLLAQAEHDILARAVLVTTSKALAQQVLKSVEKELAKLETEEVARSSWESNGEVILVPDLKEAVAVANEYAPEHLEVHIKAITEPLMCLYNYGSLFLGERTPVVFGDYVSGSNHILPTMGTARFASGLWVGTFLKISTYQRVSEEAQRILAPVAQRLAKLEGLFAHALAAQLRLKNSNVDEKT